MVNLLYFCNFHLVWRYRIDLKVQSRHDGLSRGSYTQPPLRILSVSRVTVWFMDQSTCRRYHKSKKLFLYVRSNRTTPLFGHWKPALWHCRSATNRRDKISLQYVLCTCFMYEYARVNLITIINPLRCVLLTLGLEWKRSSTVPTVETSINYWCRENFWRSFENTRNIEVFIDIVWLSIDIFFCDIIHKRDFCLLCIMSIMYNDWLNLSFRYIFYIYIN